MPQTLTPQERIGAAMLAGGNPKVSAVLEAVMARQPGSVECQQRALRALSGTPSLLAFEAPMLPLAVQHAAGGRITDVDGNTYIDCHMAYTASVLGHNPPTVAAAVAEALPRGIGGGHFFEEQVQLGELVQAMVPDVERVALFHTGGEAVNAAVRMARAATRRRRVAKFEGCYHGSNAIGLHNTWMILSGQFPQDPLDAIRPAPATAGLTPLGDEDLFILPFNLPAAFDLIRSHADELAAVVVDPVPTFMSPFPDDARTFLQQLGAVTEEVDVPLVLDEIVCGFRLARGGAREWADTTPAMSCFGKITSGLGIPLSIVAGTAKYLDTIRSNGLWRDYGGGKAWVASTLSSNFLAVVASLAQLRYVNGHYDEIIGTLDRNEALLRERLAEIGARTGLPVSLQGNARTQLQLAVGKPEITEKTYRHMMEATSPDQFRQLLLMTFYLRLNGVYVKGVPTMNLSAGHTTEDVEELAAAIEKTLVQMQADGVLVV